MIKQMSGGHELLIKILYSKGLRLTEELSLRVKDIVLAQNQITVRDTKGNESRVLFCLNSYQLSLLTVN